MGNTVRSIATKIYNQNENSFPDKDPPDLTQVQYSAFIESESIISIPIDSDMMESVENIIQFRARHAATDFPVTVRAHRDHKICTLKLFLIEYMRMPFSSADGKCKILMVWNKPDLPRDEPLQIKEKHELEMNQRFLGGSIDHLKLGEYGLENEDRLMFTVMFPQILQASHNSVK